LSELNKLVGTRSASKQTLILNLTGALLLCSPTVPFLVMSGWAEKYEHILTDESRDTRFERNNLPPLVENTLANGLTLRVWRWRDAKQAIYRWRGRDGADTAAAPSNMAALEEESASRRCELLRGATEAFWGSWSRDSR
jgi:hypothetical protein